MLLPNLHEAIVNEAKLTGYLLSATHPIGRFKSAFFTGLGFTSNDSNSLNKALRSLITKHEVAETQETDYGIKYLVAGELVSPSGRAASVVTVWIILNDEDAPRFVTAYPR